MNITDEQMKMLAQLERDMDSGKQPYVVHQGERLAFRKGLLDECGLESGQSVSSAILLELMKRSLAHVEVELALKKARETE